MDESETCPSASQSKPSGRTSWHRLSGAFVDVRLSYLQGLSSLPETWNTGPQRQDSNHDIARPEDLFADISSRCPSLTALPQLDDAGKAEKQYIEDIEAADAASDDSVVSWNGDDDPQNPQNWSGRKKWSQMVVISWISFITPMASSMLAPGMPQISREFGVTSTPLLTFAVSGYTLGFAVGAVLVAPLSEMYGRLPLYHSSNVFCTVFALACAFAPTYSALIAFRVLAGTLGSSCIVLGSSTVIDIFPRAKRGAGLAVIALGTLLGPSIGPVIGGELVDELSWEWIFYVLASVAGANIVLGALVLRETYAPILLEQKVKHLRQATGDTSLHSKAAARQLPFAVALIRPLRMLVFSPTTLASSMVSAVLYGVLYLQITTIPFVFGPRYGFSAKQTGLVYLAPGVGTLLALPLTGRLADVLVKRSKARGHSTPETARLAMVQYLPSSLLSVASLLLYGWTAQYHLPWPVPLLGLLLYNFALLFQVGGLQVYLIEQYPMYAASAAAATALTRSLATGLLPLSGLDLYYALGLGWANTVLASLTFAAAIIVVVLRFFGSQIRTRFDRQF